MPDNGSMLPWCTGSLLFRYTIHLWLWHMVRQKLHHILKKCLKALCCCSVSSAESLYVAAVSPVHKITFSEEFNSSLTIKSSLNPYGYTGYMKKSKSKGIANLLSNVFLIAFSWIVADSDVPSAFFAPVHAFKPLADCIP